MIRICLCVALVLTVAPATLQQFRGNPINIVSRARSCVS